MAKRNPEIDQYGNKFWYNKTRRFHRDHDLPAVEWLDGTKAWYKNGYHHRIGGPAVEWPDGGKSWYINGTWHTQEGHYKAVKNMMSSKDYLLMRLKYG